MRVWDAAATAAALPYGPLVTALHAAYAAGWQAPMRHHHGFGTDQTLLLMPGWSPDLVGVKIVTVTPGNAARGLDAVAALYLVLDAATGAPLGILDGATLTARRTAAVAALGARLLARADARHLTLMGAGRVAAELPAALATVLPLTRITVWNPGPGRGQALVATLRAAGWDAAWQPDARTAVAEADVVSCATLATHPVLQGAWLRPGQHVDLIGSFTPAMREVDDTALRRAHLYVDGPTALSESGDLADPLARGVINAGAIRGTLWDLCAAPPPPRDPAAITLFKAVGNAVSDLAAATLAWGRAPS